MNVVTAVVARALHRVRSPGAVHQIQMDSRSLCGWAAVHPQCGRRDHEPYQCDQRHGWRFRDRRHSQGVMVAAPVYRSLRSGPLAHRRSAARRRLRGAPGARRLGVRVVQDTLRGAPANVLPLTASLLPYFSGAASINGAPHGQYGTYKPLPGNPKTCVDLAVDYLDTVAH
jgi:hypothetical protein